MTSLLDAVRQALARKQQQQHADAQNPTGDRKKAGQTTSAPGRPAIRRRSARGG